MSTVLAGEEDGTLALDPGDGAIAKLDGTTELGVDLTEDVPWPDHVVGGTGVEDPLAVVDLLHWSEISEDLLLHNVDDVVRCDQRRRGGQRGSIDDGCERVVEDDFVGQKKAMLLFFTLDQFISLLLAILLGPVDFLATIGA
jgi:hypothetical protein